jgi:AraC-like DNA-binding protein
MDRKSRRQFSRVEHDVFATIQRLRAAHFDASSSGEAEEPAEMMREILGGYHGHVKLRLEVISAALGRTMRTLEREFSARYSETMNSFQGKTRLKYAEMQISYNPDVKITAVAAELGYDRESEFNRFFRRKKGESPTQFARRIRNGIESPARQ